MLNICMPMLNTNYHDLRDELKRVEDKLAPYKKYSFVLTTYWVDSMAAFNYHTQTMGDNWTWDKVLVMIDPKTNSRGLGYSASELPEYIRFFIWTPPHYPFRPEYLGLDSEHGGIGNAKELYGRWFSDQERNYLIDLVIEYQKLYKLINPK